MKEHGTAKEKKNAPPLRTSSPLFPLFVFQYYSYPWNYVFAWLWTTSPLLATANPWNYVFAWLWTTSPPFDATKSSSDSTNVQQTSTISELDVSTKELEDNEEIKFDITNISMELKREPTVEWVVGCINVIDRFRQYQKDVLKKAEREGLKYENSFIVNHCALLGMSIPHVHETRNGKK
ncbi:8815_t:CDS:2 [Acaulospora morrowiae]|uniref:8815_t:CDS:1 n=1 Tax=Acaulospora morrowiae TaxID=94023 RepID=A0A9N9AH78_9GLOM|nr:8815_t:CDS:2 [Acaulospora morrowiae]